jgi:2-oxo-4-hydroxy-4-carboxy-5-ureidoimidazoline decarboxylase
VSAPPTGVAALLDRLADDDAARELLRCCGCARWVRDMVAARPFGDDAAVHAAATLLWGCATEADVLEALSHHPEIGSDLAALRSKFASTATWSGSEQSQVAAADEGTLVALRDGNLAYRAKFGFLFVICATGKSATQMLEALRDRLGNDRATELANAAREQGAITHLRLDKLVTAST